MPRPTAPNAGPCRDRAPVSRREFMRNTTGAIGAAGALGMIGLPRISAAAEAAVPATSETLVAQLFGSLTDGQKKAICFPFDHDLRLKVDNNWFITEKHIGELLKPDQQDLVKQIFMGIHSPEYAQKVYDQVEHDGGGEGTFKECSIALFGDPDPSGAADKGKFEFVLTGRHCTRRCDGNSVAGAAFGGPIFYGHAATSFNEPATHPGNAYWFQAVRANEVFKALDGKQRKLALRSDPRKEEGTQTVALSGKRQGLAGVPLTELSSDQKDLVRKVMADLLAPFRKADADEAMMLIEGGGFDHLRGAPHVHTWVNIREPAAG